ncbi:hypothetical protein CC1G_10858 [Coprinopsis cinerea okayama7|uniref:MYND-type domain-containing protein n=1 Tax=Coprinopsis cinerea (strain Okayama-7 / 130 / ATCC MYA-4618 / FGSC 9003) TaxID=240176 RepID=A8NKT4_COPC7|nr:hypothetical protein CC1G_10858 [Coprinopsis cinerea okayama7\|eukprot:XP_001834540.1 hypothetical protein CC1G_10858 [Coprinopsis cinerea okayama7\
MAPRDFASILIRAKSGNPESLDQLASALTPQTYDLDVLDTFLRFLDEDLVPDIPSGEHKQEKYQAAQFRALPCITALSAVASICREEHHWKDETVKRLVDHLDGIIKWINFLLYFGLSIPLDTRPGCDFRLAYFIHSALLLDLIDLDTRIEQALYSSTPALDTLIKVWVTTGKRSAVFQSFDRRQKDCPIIRLMHRCLSSTEGLLSITERVFSREMVLREVFAEAFLERARQTQDAINNRAIPSTKATSHLVLLMQCGGRILKCQPFLDLLFSTHLFATLFESFIDIVANLVSFDRLIPLDQGFTLIQELISMASDHSPRAHNIVSLLFRDGFIDFASQAVASVPEDADTSLIRAAKDVVTRIEVLTSHPNLSRIAEDQINELLGNHRIEEEGEPSDPSLVFYNRQLDRFWNDMYAVVDERNQVLFRHQKKELRFPDNPVASYHSTPRFFPKVYFCDNFQCTTSPLDLRSQDLSSRKCSACSLMVYCSLECQHQDWVLRHREECIPARFYYTDGRCYRNYVRSFHVACIEHVFNRTMAGQMVPYAPFMAPVLDYQTDGWDYSDAIIEKWSQPIYRFDATKSRAGIDLYPKKYPYRTTYKQQPCLLPSQQARFDELLDEMSQHPTDRTDGEVVRFVEGMFTIDNLVVLLLVKLRLRRFKETKAAFVAVANVARVFAPSS